MGPKHFALVLHSHIPFVVGHGTWPHGLDWLNEAAAESYLPLLGVLRRMIREGVSPRVTIGFTPVLAEQLKTASFGEGLTSYLRMKVEAARADASYFIKSGNESFFALARYWEHWYEQIARQFIEECRGDILDGFKTLQDEGHIEILTSAATHGYFPLLSEDKSIARQVRQGRVSYRRHFGREARGFWLPECAYRPGYSWKSPFGSEKAVDRKGVDVLLAEEGIDHFFVPTHLLQGGASRGVYEERFPALRFLWDTAHGGENECGRKDAAHSPYSPYRVHPSSVSILAGDEVSGKQVWSRNMGYPGDGDYLEFHKKHFPGGLRYWRITSEEADLALKEPYAPEKAEERLESHSSHFVHLVQETLRSDDRRVAVALFDTELLGHWWFEGPEWLYRVLKKLDNSPVRSITAGRCLEELPPGEMVSLPEGSWGEGGFHSVWLNKDTAWIWEKIYEVEHLAFRVDADRARRNPRLVKQLMREKFLLESSDWPFLVSTRTAKDYAENRAAEHFDRARALCEWLDRSEPLSPAEEAFLAAWETEDCLFPEVIGLEGETLGSEHRGDQS